MAVDLGQAQGSLTLDAAAFFASVQSSINEIHSLHDAAAQAASGVDTLEGSLSGVGGAGSGLSGAMSGVSDAASVAATGVENVGDAATAAGTNTNTFRSRLSSAWQAMRDSLPTTEEMIEKLDSFGNSAVTVGKNLTKYVTTPLAGVGVYSVKTAMTFEKSMSQVAATMGVSVDEIQDLTNAAKAMGETTQYTSTEAAQALNYLALAGYNSEQMIAALPNVLNLAAAGGMDLADASDMLTDGLSALNLASSDTDELMENMSTMVDQMAKTASRSNTSVSQLGDAILTVGGTASYLKGGLSEVNQVVGLMADRGIKASEAGTHLRNIILAMQPATTAAEEAFKKVGLATEDAEGNFVNLAYNTDGTMKSLQEIFQILQEGTATMTDMEKQNILADIFHKTDLASISALLGTSQERWSELADEIDNAAGSGAQMAETQLNNLSGELTLLKSKLDGVATTIGEILSPVVSQLLDKISGLLDDFKELDPETQQAIVKFGLMAAAIGPVVTVLGKVALAVSGVMKAFRTIGLAISSLGPTISSAVAALGAPVTLGLTSILSGVGAFLAGYGIGTLIYNAIGDEIDEVLYPIFDGVVEAWGVLVEFFTETIPDAFNTCLDFVTGVGSEISNTVSSALSSVAEFFTGIFTSIIETFSGIAAWVDENIIQPVLSVIVPIATKIYEINAKIVEIVVTLLGVLAQWVYDNVITPIMNGITTMVNWVTSKFQALWDSITGVWAKIASWWTEHVSDPISNLMLKASEWISEKFSAAYDKITEVFGVIGEFFAGVWEDIKTALSEVGTWFGETFQAAYDKISEIFGGIKDFFSGVWEDIQSVFSTAADYIAEAFDRAFAAAFNVAMTGVEDVVNFFVDSLNSVVDVINEIPGVDIGKLDRLSLPKLSVGLDYVPYDNYGAVLHKGERVLTAEENQEYSSGRAGGGDTYIFNSPEPIDERTAAQEMKRVKQELAEGF